MTKCSPRISLKSNKTLFRRGKNARKIIKYSIHGEKLRTYSNASDAGRNEYISCTTILRACKCKDVICGGYIWRYEGDLPPKEDIEYTKRKVVQMSMDWKIIKEWNSISEASRVTKLNSFNIYRVCIGKQLSVRCFRWKFIDSVLNTNRS